LTLRVDDGGTVEATDSTGLDTFMGVGLGTYAKQGGGVLLYDDLEVSEAS
jgi:hypothetical protein